MIRSLVFALAVVGLAAEAPAQQWAQKMFKATSHEFGTVARGAKSEFAFELVNSYEEDVHIAGVRSSCGCTTPTITQQTLKTWEKGAIVATFNTQSFLGQRTATITVTFDKPYFAEVQLRVAGTIRGDIDFQPGSISFGDVEQGKAAENKVTVTHHSRSDWQILDIRSVNEHLEVELSDPMRTPAGLAYQMLVRLKPTAPVGYLQDQLTLVTNDKSAASVPVMVEGRVVSPVSISPSSVFLGVMQPGQTVTKQLVVRGKQPFHVLGVKCGDPALQCQTKDDARLLHLIPITYKAGAEPGEVEETIEVQTDLSGNASATCVVRGTIKAGKAETPTAAPSISVGP